jgi:hypothetical protein
MCARYQIFTLAEYTVRPIFDCARITNAANLNIGKRTSRCDSANSDLMGSWNGDDVRTLAFGGINFLITCLIKTVSIMCVERTLEEEKNHPMAMLFIALNQLEMI